MRILGINGILSHGEDSTDKLLKLLQCRGYDAKPVDYPLATAFLARFSQKRNARILKAHHRHGDCLIAHSYGCLISLRAMEMGAKFDTVFWFAPAMSEHIVIPHHACKRLYVIHHLEDLAIKLGSWLWFHDFGKMGAVGYQGPPDDRVTNLQTFGESSYDRMLHSHYFSDRRITKWLDFIDRTLR